MQLEAEEGQLPYYKPPVESASAPQSPQQSDAQSSIAATATGEMED